jgi:hypothetical protein
MALKTISSKISGVTMTPERWQQIKVVLERALELPQEERSGFVAKLCSADDLRRDVESFLKLGDEHVRTSLLQGRQIDESVRRPAYLPSG